MSKLLILWAIITSFIFPNTGNINSINGRTNILIMGVSGKDHAGSDLTDTLIFTSVSLVNNSVSLISLPRDLWMPDIRAKLNSAYHYGGTSLAKKEVEEVVGVPTQYTVLIDFSGFKEIVNAIGGIEVNVQNSFTDNLYPIAGKENDLCGGKDQKYSCRYETVSFEKGVASMDGDTALKFVRSRHAQGDEGTDQAREARQQKVIDAIRQKVLSPSVLLSPSKIKSIYNVGKDAFETDIDAKSLAILARIFISKNRVLNNYVIPQDMLVNPPISKEYDNQYVLIPKEGNGKWQALNKWIKTTLP